MPAAYPPGDDVNQAAEQNGASHGNQDQRRSRQDSRGLRQRPSIADISRSLTRKISSIWRRASDVPARDQEDNVEPNIEEPQGTVGVPYEYHTGEDGDRLDDGWVMFRRQTRAHRWSGSGFITRQLTIRRTRNQTEPPDEAAEAEAEARTPLLRQSDGEAQPHEEQLQSAPMERSYAQSRWGRLNRLKGQISLPNLRSAAKRKHSAQDGEHSFRVKRVTLMHPPDPIARAYQQEVNDEDMAEAGPSNTRSPRASEMSRYSRYLTTGDPYSAMYEMDGEPEENIRVDSHREQPVSPRAVHANNAALDALEGNASFDDGSTWDPNNPNLPEDMARVHRQFLDMNGPRAKTGELDHFTKEQRKTFFKYVEEAEESDGFEYEEMDTTD